MRILDARILTGEDKLDKEIEAACGCDLISDLLAFTTARMLVLTGLITPQIIRAAEMMDLSGIVFVRGKKPTPEIVAMAADAGIPVLCTSYPLYESAGLLFEAGLRGKCSWPRAEAREGSAAGTRVSTDATTEAGSDADTRAGSRASSGTGSAPATGIASGTGTGTRTDTGTGTGAAHVAGDGGAVGTVAMAEAKAETWAGSDTDSRPQGTVGGLRDAP